jgi:hypothetical protein
MLEAMHDLNKLAQNKDMFICDFVSTVNTIRKRVDKPL